MSAVAPVIGYMYPPIVDTYMPAFVIDDDSVTHVCRVYFSISKLNSLEDIDSMQITVSNQYTNLNVLNPELYPCGIKLAPISIDDTRETEDKYYVEIESGDLAYSFELNQYYKVQLRFTGKYTHSDPPMQTPQAIAEWLNKNLERFSEWSTVCLIRGVSDSYL